MGRLVLAGLLWWSCCVSAAWAGMEPAYVVTVVSGQARIGAHPVAFMERLDGGRAIDLAAGARLVLFHFPTSTEYTLVGPGRFALSAAGVTRSGAGGTLERQALDPAFGRAAPPGGKLVQAGVTLRGADAAGRDSPGNGDKLGTAAPRFRWRERAHTGDYAFSLLDADEQVLAEASPAGTELVLPDLRLAPGAAYRWELRWRDQAGQARVASYRFATLDREDDATLERLRPAPDAPRARRVLFGWWLRSVGAQGAEGLGQDR